MGGQVGISRKLSVLLSLHSCLICSLCIHASPTASGVLHSGLSCSALPCLGLAPFALGPPRRGAQLHLAPACPWPCPCGCRSV